MNDVIVYWMFLLFGICLLLLIVVFSDTLKSFDFNQVLPQATHSTPVIWRLLPLGNSQFGTILEFLGYWFGLRLLLPTVKAQIEDKLEDIGKGYHWYIFYTFLYIQIIKVFQGLYTLVFTKFEISKAIELYFDIFYIIVFFFICRTVARILNKILDSSSINSFDKVIKYLKTLWRVSKFRKQIFRFTRRLLAILFELIFPFMTISFAIYFAVVYPNFVAAYPYPNQVEGYPFLLLIPVFVFAGFWVTLLSFLQWSFVWFLLFGLIFLLTFSTAPIVKTILYWTADNSSIKNRIPRWEIGLTNLGIFLQLDAANPGYESLGMLVKILGVDIIFVSEPFLSNMIAARLGLASNPERLERRTRALKVAGFILVLISIIIQTMYSSNFVNKWGLVFESIAFVVYAIDFMPSNIVKENTKLNALKVATGFLIFSFLLELLSTYL